MAVKFEDYTAKVEAALDEAVVSYLHEVSGEIQSMAMRNSRVDTGQLKGSWNYEVDESAGESRIGSPLENAVWEEFGTGQYAVNGGRKTPWIYKNRKGEWVKTKGKKPNRTLEKAWNTVKPKAKQILENILKGL